MIALEALYFKRSPRQPPFAGKVFAVPPLNPIIGSGSIIK